MLIAKLDNIGFPVLTRGARYPLVRPFVDETLSMNAIEKLSTSYESK